MSDNLTVDELTTAFSNGKMVQYKTKKSGEWVDFHNDGTDPNEPHAGKWLEKPTADVQWRLKPPLRFR